MTWILVALAKLVQLYSWALVIYILMSWFPNARETSIGRILTRICEPYLDPFRRIVPPIGMIDISPIVAFIVLNLAMSGIQQLIRWTI
ncbi:YggT family protein [Falsibacillus pallidus]|uniref:YggT family protein n=1 Tax=Falsibacillus pallidus TaxID=493781 RepID=A0A370GY33_9BACI|nr:YggT family protein [Falsibacillus pallidus]RDI47534.1 YggT family protein [Falsibacillus pallidus]